MFKLLTMKNLAPDILCQRFMIEGYVPVAVTKEIIEVYFNGMTAELNLRIYGAPIIFSPGGEGKEENQGFDAFVPLIDSGISLYFWSSTKFLSVVLYTCKSFDEEKALEFTKDFFEIGETATMSF